MAENLLQIGGWGEALILILCLPIIYNLVHSKLRHLSDTAKSAMIGFLFGLVVVAAMAFALESRPDTLVDGRVVVC